MGLLLQGVLVLGVYFLPQGQASEWTMEVLDFKVAELHAPVSFDPGETPFSALCIFTGRVEKFGHSEIMGLAQDLDSCRRSGNLERGLSLKGQRLTLTRKHFTRIRVLEAYTALYQQDSSPMFYVHLLGALPE